jgi:hypothetical protein
MEVNMKRRSIVLATVVAAGLAAAAYGVAQAQPYGGMMGGGYGPGPGMMGGNGPGPGYGPGWMHRGDGNGQGYGPGYMHRGGYGPGWMRGGQGYGPCWDNQANAGQTDLKLGTDDVKTRMERWLSFRNNPRLKLGEVKEKDADTITADIVTVDNSLVQRIDINRHTGVYQPEQGK